jgi:hypothetical protein
LHQEYRRSRLRFDDLELERFPNGRCRAWVQTEWTRGQLFHGEAKGTQTLEGEVRTAATAALAAVTGATGGRLTLELRGAKAVRAFDTWIVVVSVKAKSEEESHRLMGAFPCSDGDTAHGAVMAVLDATNRIMERYLEE